MDRTAFVNYRDHCPNDDWTVKRQQDSVKAMSVAYAPTKRYHSIARQNIGQVWAVRDGTVIRPGESWPSGASYTSVAPVSYRVRGQGTGSDNPLQGATVLAVTNPHIIGIPDGLTIRRDMLHGMWADLWITNDTDTPIALDGMRIEADDVLFIDNSEAGERIRSGDPSGHGVLKLDSRFLETSSEAESTLDELADWANNRRYRYRFTWESPDFEPMDLSRDIVFPGASRTLRPIKITETWSERSSTFTISVEAESSGL